MNNIKKLIARNIQGKRVLILFVLTNLVYAFMLLITIPKTMAFANGMKLLDMMPTGYSADYIDTLFSTLGERGREVYLYHQIPVDMIYPLLFGLSYCLLMAYFLKKIGKLDTALFYLCLLAVIASIADYSENLGIIIMLNSYPDISDFTALITNVFSVIKSFATTIYFISLLVTIAIFGANSVRGKTSST